MIFAIAAAGKGAAQAPRFVDDGEEWGLTRVHHGIGSAAGDFAGDANTDGRVDVSDTLAVLGFLFC